MFGGMTRCPVKYLSRRFKRLCHELPKILPSNLFWCEQCTGSAVYAIVISTVMKPWVLFQPRWQKPLVWTRIEELCAWKRQQIRIRLCSQDTTFVFPAELMQVDMQLHEFPNIALKIGGRLRGSGLRGHSGSGLRGRTGSGLRGRSGSGLRGHGIGLRRRTGSGLRGCTGSGLRGCSGSGLRGCT